MRYLSGLSDPLVGHYAGLILEGRSRRVTLDLVILINTNRYVALLISSGHQHKFTTNKIIWDRNNQSVTSVISRSRPVLVTPRLISCCHSPRNYLFWDAWLSSDGECWKDVPLTCEPFSFLPPEGRPRQSKYFYKYKCSFAWAFNLWWSRREEGGPVSVSWSLLIRRGRLVLVFIIREDNCIKLKHRLIDGSVLIIKFNSVRFIHHVYRSEYILGT